MVMYPRPVVIQPAPVRVVREPLYLRAARPCPQMEPLLRALQRLRLSVYFVQDSWVSRRLRAPRWLGANVEKSDFIETWT